MPPPRATEAISSTARRLIIGQARALGGAGPGDRSQKMGRASTLSSVGETVDGAYNLLFPSVATLSGARVLARSAQVPKSDGDGPFLAPSGHSDPTVKTKSTPKC